MRKGRDMVSRYGRPLGIIVLVAAALWVVGFGYWRFYVSNTLAAIETQAQQAGAGGQYITVPAETMNDLRKAGDRALPAIVLALKSDQSGPFISAISAYFLERVVRVIPLPNAEDLKIIPADPADEKERKCEAIRSIWNQVGDTRFRWWKWWTDEGLE